MAATTASTLPRATSPKRGSLTGEATFDGEKLPFELTGPGADVAAPFINEGEQSASFVVADSRVDALACKGLIVTNSGEVTENLAFSLVRGGSFRVGAKTVEVVP